MRFGRKGGNMRNLKERRKKLNLSQQNLAKQLKVDRSTVAKWETGTLPRADKLPAIARVLQCSVDELLCENA